MSVVRKDTFVGLTSLWLLRHPEEVRPGQAADDGKSLKGLCSFLQQVNQVTRLEAEEATPYVGEALRALRAEVGNEAAVLGCASAA